MTTIAGFPPPLSGAVLQSPDACSRAASCLSVGQVLLDNPQAGVRRTIGFVRQAIDLTVPDASRRGVVGCGSRARATFLDC